MGYIWLIYGLYMGHIWVIPLIKYYQQGFHGTIKEPLRHRCLILFDLHI